MANSDKAKKNFEDIKSSVKETQEFIKEMSKEFPDVINYAKRLAATFSDAKKSKMEKVTVEGADLANEIAKKVNQDFDIKKLPLMLGMINAIVDDKKLELDWESFR